MCVIVSAAVGSQSHFKAQREYHVLYVMWTMKVTTRQYNVTCYIAGMCSGLTHSFHDEVDAELSVVAIPLVN